MYCYLFVIRNGSFFNEIINFIGWVEYYLYVINFIGWYEYYLYVVNFLIG